MKIYIEAPKGCMTDQGRFAHGSVVDVSEPLGKFLIEIGDAKLYETKVKESRPLETSGMVVQSASLPVEQVSQAQTLNESKSGGKKKKKEL